MADDAATLIQYENYVGSDGQNHTTREASDQWEWIITAQNARQYCVQFDKNFAKKHLFSSSKKGALVLAEAKRLWAATSIKTKAYWTGWMGYVRSFPPEFMAQAQANVDAQKMVSQSGHRLSAEQKICQACGHEEKRHLTGGGAATPCKEGGPPACGCTPFIGQYELKRQGQGKPTVNPLKGVPTPISTYVMMSKLPKQDFETVVTDAIIAAELAGWPATTAKDITWDFGAQHMGAVITYDTATAAVANFRGITVGTKNITVDPARPTFQIYHYVGVV